MKPWKRTVLTIGSVGILTAFGFCDSVASHMELIAPIKAKGMQAREMFKMGFGICAGVVLMVRIGVGVTTDDPTKKLAMFKATAWIAGGCVAIYHFPTVLSFIGVEL